MSNHQRLDDGMRWRIVGRLEEGQSKVQICREFNLTPSIVCNLWKQFQDTGSIDRKPGQGRPRATTATEDHYTRHNRGATSSQLSRDLYAATGTRVSRVTVSKRLHETGLFARRPAVCIPFTSTNRRVRLAWCREYRDWSMDQWATVLFTDESRISLNTDSRRTFIWREPGTRYLPSNVREINHYGGGGLKVWAGIMLDGRAPFHVFERGIVTGVRYRDEILEPYVRLFRGAVGSEFILMDDNARPHRALLVDEFLDSEDICRMDWPARSPNLNPIDDCYKSQERYKNNDCGINSTWKTHRSCNPEPTEHCDDPNCRFSNSLLEGQHKISPSTCSHAGCYDTKCSHVATCCCHSHSYQKRHLSNINNPEKLNEHSLGQLTSPLNAARLRPKRHEQKDLNTVLHITADEQVVMEVLKTKKGKQCVSEVFIISTDGMEIKMYKPPKKTFLDDDPPPFPNDSKEIKSYDYQKLPKMYHGKYLVAKQFVDILRAKKPKLIINGKNARFYVMENSPDPDMKMEFYDGGSVTKKGQKICITDKLGRVFEATQNLDQDLKSMLEEFLSEKEDCEMILEFHESRRSPNFPIVFGMVKNNLNCSGKKTGKENFAPTSSKTNRWKRR
ncbi:Transposable element Tcb2 transposase [Araneus ventricosus]|uniref:Transposable element Tcb2 transposase n=1 Tax=Araneus ventricosus TaxID=182803 RepID=A0A4Y2IC75_ARAVE|nr:Transposable element Tcb2 transposase [Araneus ventricosus]